MLLTVDVRNAQTHLGVFEGDMLVHEWWLETQVGATPDALAGKLQSMLDLRGLRSEGLTQSIVSSSVPALGRRWADMARTYLGHAMLTVGPSLRTGMSIRIDHPRELGAVRLVNAVAAYARVGSGCVVVDFGTATAFDVVSMDGEYLGAILAPGLDASLHALTSRAAALPSTTIERPVSLIGRTTVEAMHSGVVYGAAGLCDGIIRRIRSDLNWNPTVLATGPLAPLVSEFSDAIRTVEPTLTLDGLRLIHGRNP